MARDADDDEPRRNKPQRKVVEKVPVKGPKGQKGFCVLYSDGSIRIDWVRFSYPHLLTPYSGKNDEGKKNEPKFGVVGLMPKRTHRDAKELIDERIDQVLKTNKLKNIAADRKFLRDGDLSGKDENEGMWIVSARESNRPPLRDRDNSRVTNKERIRALFVGGHWGSILIRPWFQKNDFGKRVNAGISSVQYLMKDEQFGEGRISDEALDDTFEDYGDPDDIVLMDDDDEDEDERPSRRRSRDDDDDEDERPKRRRSRDDDDDEDDRPQRRRSRDDDDEEETPRRRRSRDDDDDDDRPSRRRRSRDDDDEDERPRRRRSREEDDVDI